MASIAKLVVSLGANIAGFETDMKRASRNQQKRMREMEKGAKEMGKAVAVGFTALSGVIALAVKSAVEFEDAMAEVSTLLDDTSGLKATSDAVRALAVQFGKMPVEEAKALYQIISAGASSSAQQMELLTAANKLAVGGITSVEVAADGLTNIINAYGKEAESVSRISDVMFATMKAGKTTIGEISKNIGQLSLLAAQLGIDIGTVGATLATVTGVTGNTATATTMLKAAFTQLLAPAAEARELFDGIGFGMDAIASKGGLLGYLDALFEKTGGNVEVLKKMFGSVEALQAVLALATDNFGKFTDNQKKIAEALGLTDEAFDKMAATVGHRSKVAAAAIEDLRITIGQELLAAVSDTLQAFQNNLPVIREYAKALGQNVAKAAEVAGRAFKFLADNITLVEIALAAILARKYLTAFLFAFGGAARFAAMAIGAVAAALVIAANDLQKTAKAARPLEGAVNDLESAVDGLTDAWINNAAAADIMEQQAKIRQAWLDAEIEKTKALEELTKRGYPAGALTDFEITNMGPAQVKMWQDLTSAIDAANAAQGDAEAKLAAFNKRLEELRAGVKPATEAIDQAGESLGGMAVGSEAAEKALADLLDEINPLVKATKEYEDRTKNLKTLLSRGAISWKQYSDAVGAAKVRLKEVGDGFSALDKYLKDNEYQLNRNKRLWQEVEEGLDDIIEEQGRYEDSIKSILDELNPLEKATRDYNQQLADTRRYAASAAGAGFDLAAAEKDLAENFRKTTEEIKRQGGEVDLLATAIDESVRIMERTFTDMWQSILSGAELSFDGIADAFKTLLANLIHQATTQKITLNIQQGIQGQGTGPGGGINWAQLGTDFGTFAALAIGQSVADTSWGQWGSAIGAAWGLSMAPVIAAAFSYTSLAALGSIAGPIGAALGAIIGALAGDFLNDIFARPFNATLGGANQRTRADNQTITTAFGDVLGIRGGGGWGDFADSNTPAGQFAESIMEFDQGMYDLLSGLVSPDQMDQIIRDFADWTAGWSEANLTIENVLGSRFGVILRTFSAEIQSFVQEADDLEGMVERLGVAAAAQKLMTENAGIFGEASLGDFLRVVQGYQQGGRTLTEAFEMVLPLLDQVAGVMAALRQYADSDVAGDLEDMLAGANRTLFESVALMQDAMMSAIADWDGSVEQLQAIGQMSMTVRQQELALLQQIDDIAKGVSARLQSLREFVSGTGAPEKNFGQLYIEAEGLLAQIGMAQSPEEIARLTEQFDALIRQIPQQSIENMRGAILMLVDQFDEASADRLATMRQDVIDNAAETRRIVDEFLDRIGPALDVVANMVAVDPLVQAEATGQAIAVGMEGSLDRQEEILELGIGGIRDEVIAIGPAIAASIQQGFGSANVTVNIQVDDGLTNG